MQAKFPGKCRDCGNKFPAGTDIDWQKGQGASCCNGTQYPSPGAEFSPGIEERQAGLPDPRPQVAKAGRAFIVDGAMKMEWVEEKTYQEIVDFMADSPVYEERVYSGYNWMCFECKLVWDKQHQAKNCGKRDHVTAYEDTYGVREVLNGVPTGPNMYTITRTAIRREKSPDVTPVAPAPVPQVEEPAPKRGPAMTYMPDAIAETMEGVSKDLYAALWQIAAKLPYEKLYPGEIGTQELTERQLVGRMKKNGASAETIANLKEVLRKSMDDLQAWMSDDPQVEEPAPQADPQDMTSEQLWDSMGPGTITTSWN